MHLKQPTPRETMRISESDLANFLYAATDLFKNGKSSLGTYTDEFENKEKNSEKYLKQLLIGGSPDGIVEAAEVPRTRTRILASKEGDVRDILIPAFEEKEHYLL